MFIPIPTTFLLYSYFSSITRFACNLSALFSCPLLNSGHPALSLFRACPCTELGLQSMVGVKNYKIEIIAPGSRVYICKLDVVRKGVCFLFRILGIFISLAWPSCVYEKKNSGKRYNDKKFLYSSKLTSSTKGRPCLWHPPPLWTTAGLHRDGPHQRGFDCIDLGVWWSIGILLFCSPSFWSRFNRRNFCPALRKQHLVFTRIKCISKAWKRILISNLLEVTGKTGLDSVISVALALCDVTW